MWLAEAELQVMMRMCIGSYAHILRRLLRGDKVRVFGVC